MKKMIISAFLFLPMISWSQEPIVKDGCNDLFISEIMFQKTEFSQDLIEYNYAIEIYNPTQYPISLDGYKLQLTNSASYTFNVLLDSGQTLDPGEVHVIANDNASLNLQDIANELVAGLEFENYVMLELVRNTTVLDRIGQVNVNSVGGFDILLFLQDPYGYLSSSGIDFSDFENMSLRRGLFVDRGDPNFYSPADMLGKWSFSQNITLDDLGKHTNICHRPLSEDYVGYYLPESSMPATDNSPIYYPLDVSVNGAQNGTPFSNSNNTITLTHTRTAGPATICNGGGFYDLNWSNFTGPAPCNSHTFSHIGIGSERKIKTTMFAINNAPSYCIFTISSSSPNVIIDWANPTHRVNITKPLSVKEIPVENLPTIYPTIVNNSINIESKVELKYYFYDVTGRLCKEGKLSQGTHNVDCRELSDGLYIITFKDIMTNAKFSAKFVKN